MDVRPVGRRLGLRIRLAVRPPPTPSMRGRIDVIHEPALRSHGRSDRNRPVLARHERLEVVVDDRLGDWRTCRFHSRTQQDRVPAEPFRQSGNGGLRAGLRAGDLAVSGARGESRGDTGEQAGTLQVVRRGERLPGARAPAVAAEKPRDPDGVELSSEESVPIEAGAASDVRRALRPRTEGRTEPRRTHALDGMTGPPHAPPVEQAVDPRLDWAFRAFSVHWPTRASAGGRPAPDLLPHSRGHRG